MTTREWTQFGREFLSIAVTTALFIGPAGCRLQALPSGGSQTTTDLKTLTGLFINDSGDGPLMAARGQNGDQFFVYGTRNASGGLEEVQQIVVEQADGSESFVTFESGRPVHAQGPDGSYLHITYDVVETFRLQATVDLFNVDTQTTDSYAVDIDLRETANTIAQRIQDVTGIEVPVTAAADAATAKGITAQTRITIFSPFFAGFIAPFVILINVMVVVIGQIVNILANAIAAVAYSVMLVVLTPFFAIANLLNDTIVNIQLVPLVDAFTVLPPPLTVVLAG